MYNCIIMWKYIKYDKYKIHDYKLEKGKKYLIVMAPYMCSYFDETFSKKYIGVFIGNDKLSFGQCGFKKCYFKDIEIMDVDKEIPTFFSNLIETAWLYYDYEKIQKDNLSEKFKYKATNTIFKNLPNNKELPSDLINEWF